MEDVKAKLQKELDKLEHELHFQLPKAIQHAREFGDLSENAEYKAAKERQSMVQARISQLHMRLMEVDSIDISKIPTDRIAYGSTQERRGGRGPKADRRKAEPPGGVNLLCRQQARATCRTEDSARRSSDPHYTGGWRYRAARNQRQAAIAAKDRPITSTETPVVRVPSA